MLTVESLTVAYGGLTALCEISLVVRQGQFVSIVGPNGAGKTTLFKAISGTVQASAGRIRFEDTDLLAVAPSERAHFGIAHVPEGRQVFGSMTVMENLEMGGYPQTGRRDWKRNLDRIFSLFPVLAERRAQAAGTLSGGEQQMLALGRAMMSEPRLVCLDEPSLGLAPLVVRDIFATIRAINAAGTSVLLVEQNARYALETASRAYVLQTGSIIASGTCAQLRNDDRVRQAYLGRSAAAAHQPVLR